jgi:hypothetical protein
MHNRVLNISFRKTYFFQRMPFNAWDGAGITSHLWKKPKIAFEVILDNLWLQKILPIYVKICRLNYYTIPLCLFRNILHIKFPISNF